MPTNAKTKAKRTAERKSRQHEPREIRESKAANALDLLEQDHRKVERLLDEFDEVEDDDEKKNELTQKICIEVTVHTQIEEEIFYPEARKATGDQELIDEALVEHASAKHLIDEIEEMRAGEDLFDAKVKVLGEQVKRHIMEEEEELFPELEQTKMDLVAIGEKLMKREAELLKEFEKV